MKKLWKTLTKLNRLPDFCNRRTPGNSIHATDRPASPLEHLAPPFNLSGQLKFPIFFGKSTHLKIPLNEVVIYTCPIPSLFGLPNTKLTISNMFEMDPQLTWKQFISQFHTSVSKV